MSPHPEATEPEEPTSPVLANIIAVLGFAVIFTTFVFDTPWAWIIGIAMVVAAGLWAGFAGSGFAEPVVRPEEPTTVEGARAVREGNEPPSKPDSGRVEQSDGRTT